MESKMVIKVQNGQMLRRFTATIGEDGKLGLDITKLREKIATLFGISPVAFFTLSYVDEDGDNVALVDDDDLHDVMNQYLNPLRITVIPCAEFGDNFFARSPQLDLDFLSNVLKSIPEPLRESLSKISMEVASTATCTGQVIAGLIDSIAKLGQSLNAETARNGIPSQKIELNNTTNEIDTQSANAGIEGLGSGSMNVSDPSDYNSKVNVKIANGTALTKSVQDTKMDSSSASGDSVMANKFSTYLGFNAISSLSDSDSNCEPPSRMGYKCNIGYTSNVSHKGVQCYGCGVQPILGPRFKSLITRHRDLCRICFLSFGHEGHYIRMDEPNTCPYLYPHPSFNETYFPVHMPSHAFQETIENDGPKLDSHFVLDINILDGTALPPLTQFTKIWRMKNNGNISWPKGTKLVWIGGDRFSNGSFVESQAIEQALAVDEEINIAVEFCAPVAPGRYSSYWRLATPSGQKFGQRVWVIIEVDTSLPDNLKMNYARWNLNLPPVDAEANGFDINMIDIQHKKEPMMTDHEPCFPYYSNWTVGSSDMPNFLPPDAAIICRPVFVGTRENTSPFSAPPLAPWSPKSAAPPLAPWSPKYAAPPLAPWSPKSAAPPLAPWSPNSAAPATTIQPTENNNNNDNNNNHDVDVEQRLQAEPENTDFNNLNLNLNEKYYMQQTLDDFSDLGEWDPILDDLEEMDFHRTFMPKRTTKDY